MHGRLPSQSVFRAQYVADLQATHDLARKKIVGSNLAMQADGSWNRDMDTGAIAGNAMVPLRLPERERPTNPVELAAIDGAVQHQ